MLVDVVEQGLRQALAATKLFYSSDLSAIDVSEVIKDLDGRSSSVSETGSLEFTSLIKRLSREEVIDKPISEVLRLSGLVATKSKSSLITRVVTDLLMRIAQARAAVEHGNVHLNGVRIPPKSHQRLLESADLRENLLILRLGKNTNLAIVLE